jgi:hypothetical protein
LDDKHPFVALHVQFDGTSGLYEIIPIITITDGHGRNRTKITYETDGVWPAVGIVDSPDAEKLRRL